MEEVSTTYGALSIKWTNIFLHTVKDGTLSTYASKEEPAKGDRGTSNALCDVLALFEIFSLLSRCFE